MVEIELGLIPHQVFVYLLVVRDLGVDPVCTCLLFQDLPDHLLLLVLGGPLVEKPCLDKQCIEVHLVIGTLDDEIFNPSICN